MRLSDDSLRGRTVIGADGHAVGEVAALVIETDGWNVTALEVKLRKGAAEAIGTHRRMFRVPTLEVPVRFIQSIGDAVVHSVPLGGLRQVPTSPGEAPLAAH